MFFFKFNDFDLLHNLGLVALWIEIRVEVWCWIGRPPPRICWSQTKSREDTLNCLSDESKLWIINQQNRTIHVNVPYSAYF